MGVASKREVEEPQPLEQLPRSPGPCSAAAGAQPAASAPGDQSEPEAADAPPAEACAKGDPGIG
jgi:hypothetical protein